jgi:hypothetical protein
MREPKHSGTVQRECDCCKRRTVRSLGGAEHVGLELVSVELSSAGAVLGVDVLTTCALNAVVSTMDERAIDNQKRL